MVLDMNDAVDCCRELYGRSLELALAEYIVEDLIDRGYTDTEEVDPADAEDARRQAGEETGIPYRDMGPR